MTDVMCLIFRDFIEAGKRRTLPAPFNITAGFELHQSVHIQPKTSRHEQSEPPQSPTVEEQDPERLFLFGTVHSHFSWLRSYYKRYYCKAKKFFFFLIYVKIELQMHGQTHGAREAGGLQFLFFLVNTPNS